MTLLTLDEVLDRVTQVSSDVVAPAASDLDRDGRWPAANMRALQDAGLGGLVVPTTSGGLGYGLPALARVCEILGAACPSTALCFGMHCVGAGVLAAKATRDQEERYLVPIAEGRHLTTLALSEPGTGAHFYLPETRLVPVAPDGFEVNGVKTFVTSGGYADSYVVSTMSGRPEAPPGEFSLVVIPQGVDGVVWGPPWTGLGMRGNASRRMELHNVRVPRRDLLGEEGEQIWYIFHVVAPYFITAMAGTYLGIATAALEEARRHLGERRYSHAGASLVQNNVLQHRLGVLWAQVERTRRLVYHAAASVEDGQSESLASMLSAKAEVADCAVNVVNEAMTLSGGIAYRENSRLERALRDVRAAPVMAPTTDILRVWVGRLLLGQPLLAN